MSYGTYCRLGVTVWASDRAVIRAARRKLKPASLARKHRQARHDFYRMMLKYHHADRAIVKTYRL